MWDETPADMMTDEMRELLARRDDELRNDDALFKQVLSRGAEMFRHTGSVESAHHILRAAIGHLPATPLHMQHQIAVDGVEILQTDAGRELRAQIDAGAATHQATIDDVTAQIAALRPEYDEEYGTHSAALSTLNDQLGKARAGLYSVERAQQAVAEMLETVNRRNTQHGASSLAGVRVDHAKYKKVKAVRLAEEVARGMYGRFGLVRGVVSRALKFGFLRKRRGERLG